MRGELTLLSIALVLTSSAQSLVFKRVGYSGVSPQFILIFVASVFVPIFFTAVCAIRLTTGGFVPESTVLSLKLRFLVIGLLNAANGILVIFANPHVPGCLQTLLSQAVIPFTLILARLLLGTRFSKFHYGGALLIAVGIMIDVWPRLTGNGAGSQLLLGWVLAFGAAQLPAAIGSIYQEVAFAQAKVNVVYMMAWSSLGQVVVLLCMLPLISEATQQSFRESLLESLGRFRADPHARFALIGCVATMLLSQILSALLVKRGSAALASIVITLVTPTSTIAFTIPAFMGVHVEQMQPSAWTALAVMLTGIGLYRSADIELGPELRRVKRLLFGRGVYSQRGDEGAVDGSSTGGVDRGGGDCSINSGNVEGRSRTSSDPGVLTPLLRKRREMERQHERGGDEEGRPRPALLASRIGLISSEYTAASNDPRSIFFEHTRPLARSRSLGGGLRQLGEGA